MPVLTVNTNVTADKIPKDFKKTLTMVVASSLVKPSSYVAIQVNSGQDITFGGTEEPAALCELISIGSLSVESNKKHSAAIMNVLKLDLKIPLERIYICFKDTAKGDCGYNGTTFDELM